MFLPVIILILVPACAAQSWTEARVIELFSRQSPQVVAVRAQVAVARAEARGRALYSNPSFLYSREGAGFAEFFQAEQELPLSGRVGLLRRAVEPAAGAAEAQADALVWQLRADVRQAFYRLLRLQEQEAVQNATIGDLQEVRRVLVAREKEGEGSRFHRLRGERELVEVRAELALISAQTAQGRARLLELLPPGTEIAGVEGMVMPSAALPPLDELLSRAVAARSEIRAANQTLARLRFEQQAAGRLRYPDPVVAAGVKRGDVATLSPSGALTDRAQNGIAFSLSIPIPSFNRGQTEVSRLSAEQTRMEAQRRALEHEIRAQVTGAYRVLALRRDALERYRQDLGETNRDLRQIAQVAYQEGEVGILELLDVFRLHRQSQQRLLELEGAVREALIELERVTGEGVTP